MNNSPEKESAHACIDEKYIIASFYKFVPITNLDTLQSTLYNFCWNLGIYGTILLADEGINGTIAGTKNSVKDLYQWFCDQPNLNGLKIKYSEDTSVPFHRLKVRIKKEIVTMGKQGIDPISKVGTYIDPLDWNLLLKEKHTVIIDARNHYEVEIGTFDKALNPKTNSFRDFPAWVTRTLEKMPNVNKDSKIAMFCTGGIRCEKATSYLKDRGYKNVFHLEGGILKYFEDVSDEENLWNGECFVFDNRVSLKKDLQPGEYLMCHACRMPLAQTNLGSKKYSPGLHCPKCYGTHSEKQIKRFKDRQRQMELSNLRGLKHLGSRGKQDG